MPCSIADFLQELPVVVKNAMPTLSMMFGEEVERRLGVRELQTAFVHSLLLAKKARVSRRSVPVACHEFSNARPNNA